MKKILSLVALVTAIATPLITINRATAADLPGLRRVNLSQLKNGQHQVCMETPDSGLTCLWFQKRGLEITGTYFYPATESIICIEGRLSTKNNTIRGIAVQDMRDGGETEPELSPEQIAAIKGQGNQYVNWIDLPENKLRLAKAKYIGDYKVKYGLANLSLTDRMYYVPGINAGRSAQPIGDKWVYSEGRMAENSCLKN
jgi:hypothetical protein